MDERELERKLKAGLEAHAEDADVTAPVAARAAQVARRRRGLRWGATAAVAAAVVVAVGGVAVLNRGDERADPELPVATDPTGEAPPAPTGWRTEYWHGLAVDVPADWGYGGAPMQMSDTPACYPGVMRTPEGGHVPEGSDTETGWVGRPIMMTDVCAVYPWLEHSPQETPEAPYVWLGAAVAVGTVEYDNGYVQETVEAEGTTLTVGSDDADLRERVLDSARSSGDGPCGPDLPTNEPVFDIGRSDGDPVAMNVCVYKHPDRRGEGPLVDLAHGATVGQDGVGRYLAALDGLAGAQCPRGDARATEWVVLELLDDEGATIRYDVVHLGRECAGIDVGPDGLIWQDPVQLVPGAVAPWADGGIGATVLGAGAGDWQYDYFIGIQG